MENWTVISVVSVSAAVFVTWLLTRLSVKVRYEKMILKEESEKIRLQAMMDTEKVRFQAMIDAEAEKTRVVSEQAAERLAEARKDYENSIAEIKEGHRKAIEASRNELALENERSLKAREESLKKEAEETIRAITAALNKDIRDMKDAFEAQKKEQTVSSESIKVKFAETVENLRRQTEAIGSQAVDLANALKGKNKMQGLFGETILENLLKSEGLTPGRDYDSEFWLRDRKGNLIRNEESGKRMRPDFALHFPDNTDILIDAKMSLTALSDYFSADNDERRREASERNLASVLSHIRELTDKEYQKFTEGRRTLDFVIMFIPNYGAYQLAKQEDPDIFTRAFRQNVLITTEETLVPFLRLIRSAWIRKDQMENMSRIVECARKMVDRVSLFCEKNNEVETQLRKTLKLMEDNTQRLEGGRLSILKAANEVVECGVEPSPGRLLPKAKE